MSSSLEFTISPDGSYEIHAATLLFDLHEDYKYFRSRAEGMGSQSDTLLYKRMTRASILAFHAYCEGVINRWVSQVDAGINVKDSLRSKIDRVVEKIRSMESGLDQASFEIPGRDLRNWLEHLKVTDSDTEIIGRLLNGDFFRKADMALEQLRIMANRIGLSMHDDPHEMMRPFLERLGGTAGVSTPPLSDEDEELCRIAELTFLELDAREATDGHP